MSLEKKKLDELEYKINYLNNAVGPDFLLLKDAKKVRIELENIKKKYDGKLERLEKIIEDISKRLNTTSHNQKFLEIEQRISKLWSQQEELRQQPKLDKVFSGYLRKSSEFVDLKTQMKSAEDQINAQKKNITKLEDALIKSNNELKKLQHFTKGNEVGNSLERIQNNQTDFDNKLTKLQEDYSQQQREIEQNNKRQQNYETIEESINRLTENVKYLQDFKKTYDQQNWSIDDAIEKKLNQYYSKLELNKKLANIVEELNGTVEVKVKEVFDFDEYNEKMKVEISQQLMTQEAFIIDNLQKAQVEWFKRVMALENQYIEYENLRDKVQLLEPLKSLLEDHVAENTRWREQLDNQEKVLYQDFANFKKEVKVELTDLNNNIVDRLKPISKFEATIRDIESKLISLQSSPAKALKESTEQDLEREEEITTVILEAHILEVRELIKKELDKVKTEWLDSISAPIIGDQKMEDHQENIITTDNIREELNNLLAEESTYIRLISLLRETIDNALKLPLSQVDKVEKYLKDELKTVARKEDYTGFDDLFDDISHRLNSIESRLEKLNKSTASISKVDQEKPQELKEEDEKSDSKILWEQLIYYTPQPNIDDVFIQSKVSTIFKQGKTIYQIKLNSKMATEAELHLVSDLETLKVAHNAPDTYLTACEFQGPDIAQLNPSNTRPGKVKWDGKNWKLFERILVH